MTFNENDAADNNDDTFATAPTETQDTFDGESAQTPPPPLSAYPAPIAPAPAVNRLTRDPYATFGGVASGVAYRFGWNVALVRFGFLLAFLFSCGFFIPAYLIAWLILPRALVWPPASDMPVPPRSGGHGLGIVASVIAVLAVMVSLVAIPVAAVAIGAAVFEHDDVNFSFGNDDFRLALYAPETLADLPPVIVSDEGFVKVNLENISPLEFEALEEPFELNIELEDGDVLLQVPTTLSYSLNAQSENGSINSYGLSGVVIDGDSMTVTNSDPDIIITVTSIDGDIELERS